MIMKIQHKTDTLNKSPSLLMSDLLISSVALILSMTALSCDQNQESSEGEVSPWSQGGVGAGERAGGDADAGADAGGD